MRRSTFIPLAVFQQLCWGRQPGFSIHDDVVAYPQFEIIFADSYIPQQEADTLLQLGSSAPSESDKSLVQQTSTPQGQATSGGEDHAFEREVSETYELMNVPPTKYLCTIPVIELPPPQNQTASELAKAEEARELIRATSAGWTLIRDLQDKCLYFVSGWWSYQFCFGVEVVQYHALQASPKDNIPLRDPTLQEYVLGLDLYTDTIEPEESHSDAPLRRDVEVHPDADAGELARVPRNTELVLKGNQRYLVQRLEAGTICDLTGRPRTIEVQYHCATVGNVDRIGWIKEVTTCAYLMAVYTPRLCQDVAFLPPKPTKAHAITCREILTPEQEHTWHERKTLEAESRNPGAVFEKVAKEPQLNVGGIMVGSRSILGAADHDGHQARLSPPRSFQRAPQKPGIVVLASGKSQDKGGAVEMLPDEAIAKLNLDPQLVERVRQELRKYAGDNGWRLEMIEGGQNGGAQMMAIVVGDEGDEEQLGVSLDDEEEDHQQHRRQEDTQQKQKQKHGRQLGDRGKQGGGPKNNNDFKAAGQNGAAEGDMQEPVGDAHQGGGGNKGDDDSGSHEGSHEEFFERGDHFRDEL